MTGQRFPAGFVFGAATSAYQIEGAATAGGRGESIWDRFTHTPGNILHDANGDVACDHYHRFHEDIALLADLGLSAYRFSIAWPRVIPDGTGDISPQGLGFYDRLVDTLLTHGVEPFVTLYHWDLPQVLEDRGGWPERGTAEAFARYAAAVASHLGDRVRFFATLNEPFTAAEQGYRRGSHAPGRREPRAATAAAHHLLLAHALGTTAIRAEAPRAEVGIVLDFSPMHPATGHPLDVEAAIVAHDHMNRWFLDPLVGRGYPPDGARAWEWAGAEIRDEDLALIAQPIDFLGVNYYTRQHIRSRLLPPLPDGSPVPRTGMGWEIYPAGLTEILEFVSSRTGELPLYITENGAAFPVQPDHPGRDPERVDYLRHHLAAVLQAIEADVPVRGYFVWSLLDNFEWAHGYEHRFGVVHIDFATQKRTVRDSGRYLSAVAGMGDLDAPWEPAGK